MLKIRLAAFGDHNGDLEIPIEDGISLHEMIVLSMEGRTSDDPRLIFNAFVNGVKVPQEVWDTTILREEDNVLVAPNIQNGDTGRLALTIIGIAVGAALFPIDGGSVLLATLGRVGVSMAFAYLGSQLFPPPKVEDLVNSQDSQTYSFGGQSNVVKKYGSVPKVYGTHRIYPPVAANPYVELEADPSNNSQSQYFYAIYDLGLGPMTVSDIKIGDTPITEFNQVQYRLVDPNKPEVSEGAWDDATESEFTFYKGDVAYSNEGIGLNGNKYEGDPSGSYEATRNAPINDSLKPQEITLNFYSPALSGIRSNGARYNQNIELEVYIAKVGTNNWVGYNDLAYNSSWSVAGGHPNSDPVNIELVDPYWNEPEVGSVYLEYYPYVGEIPGYTILRYYTLSNGHTYAQIRRTLYYGLPDGSTYMDVKWIYDPETGLYPPFQYAVGDILRYNGYEIGKIQSVVYQGTDAQGRHYGRVYFQSPTSKVILRTAYRDSRRDLTTGGAEYDFTYTLVSTTAVDKIRNNYAKVYIRGNTTSGHFSNVKFTPRYLGDYKVRITRLTSYSTYSDGTIFHADTEYDDLSLSNIVSRIDASPINTQKRHTFLEVRIKATDQLSGSIQNLSAVCTSVLDVYNGTSWVKQETNNPAWIMADILTGEINSRAIAKSRLHLPSLIEWADFCDQVPTSDLFTFLHKRYESNFVVDFDVTVKDLISLVTSSCQASMAVIDGKYGVLVDKAQNSPVQIFTPKNSRGFSSTRIYAPKPHALKVSYVDSEGNWEKTEQIVYSNGYNSLSATEFQDIETFGVTKSEQALRFGRFFLAQHELRQEVIRITVDFEHLVCARGDYVQITQDSMQVGGTAARVKSISGNTITIKEGIETDPMASYGIVFRKANGVIYNDTVTVVDADEFTLDGVTLPAAGDLVVIGEVGQVVFDCIVKSITPEDGFSATLELVERAPAIYDIDNIAEIPDYDANLSRSLTEFDPPNEVDNLSVDENSWRVERSDYEYYVSLSWTMPEGPAIDLYEIYVDNGSGYNLIDNTKEVTYEYIVDHRSLDIEHNFKVLAVSATGRKLALGEVGYVSATPLSKTTPPSDVEIFNSDITKEVLQLSWVRISDPDVDHYVIRYSPRTDGEWNTSTVLMKAARDTDLASTQARTGSYFIKAVDFNGNESVNPARIITTIPELVGLNVVDTINDFPDLLGATDRTEIVADSIVLQREVVSTPGNETFYSEGYYYFYELINLTDIYSVRLQSKIEAEGFNYLSLMVNWDPMSDVPSLNPSTSADWDVETQYRTTNILNVMSEWSTLASVAALSSGEEEDWTPWRKFIIGDAVGRWIHFRIKLSSYKDNISPRVLSATIHADMPDRDYIVSNEVAPDTGLSVVYNPAFYGPAPSPNVQISIENGEAGDYYEFTSKTLEGFNIIFYDKNDVAVSRTFDAVARGWGRKATEII